MKILSAINSVREYDALVQAGAGELYCGIYHPGDVSHGNRALNRREGLSFCLDGHDEFASLMDRARRDGVPVFLAVNSFYSTEALEKVKAQIRDVLPLSPDGLIAADISVLRYVREIGFAGKLSVSVGATVFNTEAARFYRDLGADRIILPRQLTIKELEPFAGFDGELEVIVLDDRCLFVDGFCNFHHTLPQNRWSVLGGNKWLARNVFPRVLERFNYGASQKALEKLLGRDADRFRRVCAYHYEITPVGAGADAPVATEHLAKLQRILSGHTHVDTCGLCALPRLRERGIGFVKIANRGKLTSHKVRTIRLASAAIEAMRAAGDQEAFVKQVRDEYRRIYGHACSAAHCYFPND